LRVDFLKHWSTSIAGVSEWSPLNPTEKERLRNRFWLEAVGGRYKGWVYGIGQVDRHDESIQSFMLHTQACSSKQVESEEIDRLRQRLATSKDHLSTTENRLGTSDDRLSTSEEQIHQMNSRFQAFIGAVIYYLPPSSSCSCPKYLATR